MRLDKDVTNYSQFYYVALSMFMSRSSTSVIPEIMYILTPGQLKQMVEVFGGKTVKFPSPKELSIDLMAALAVYYSTVRELTWEAVQDKLELSDQSMRVIKKRIADWDKFMRSEIDMDPVSLLKKL